MDCSMDLFMCRKCRSKIFEGKDLLENHKTDTKCSLWFLQSDEILPWVNELINEAEWTKGKLYCPNCKARIGSFDFINIIQCECGSETIPAIYCVKSKVDHKKSKVPVVDSLASNKLHLDVLDNNNKGFESQPQEISMQHNAMLSLSDDVFFNQSQKFEQLELIDMRPNKHNTFASEFTESGERETSLVEFLSLEKENTFVSSLQQEMQHESFSFACSKDFSSKILYHNKIDAIKNITHQAPCRSSQASYYELLDKASSNRSKRALYCKCQSRKYTNSYLTKRSKKKNKKRYIEDEFVNISYNSTSTTSLVNDDFSRLVCSNCHHILDDQPTKNLNTEVPGLKDWVDVDNCPRYSDSLSSINKAPKINQPISFIDLSVFENVNQVIENINNDKNGSHHESNSCKVLLHHERNDRQNYETEILEEHQCSVCWDLFYDPYKTICSHIFCSPCLRQLNKSTLKKPLCPLCRRRIYSVTACGDLKNQLKDLYPTIYSKRSKVENRNKNNAFPLPSPANVLFEDNLASADTSRVVHYLYVIRTLLMVLLCWSLICSTEITDKNIEDLRDIYVMLFILSAFWYSRYIYYCGLVIDIIYLRFCKVYIWFYSFLLYVI